MERFQVGVDGVVVLIAVVVDGAEVEAAGSEECSAAGLGVGPEPFVAVEGRRLVFVFEALGSRSCALASAAFTKFIALFYAIKNYNQKAKTARPTHSCSFPAYLAHDSTEPFCLLGLTLY